MHAISCSAGTASRGHGRCLPAWGTPSLRRNLQQREPVRELYADCQRRNIPRIGNDSIGTPCQIYPFACATGVCPYESTKLRSGCEKDARNFSAEVFDGRMAGVPEVFVGAKSVRPWRALRCFPERLHNGAKRTPVFGQETPGVPVLYVHPDSKWRVIPATSHALSQGSKNKWASWSRGTTIHGGKNALPKLE